MTCWFFDNIFTFLVGLNLNLVVAILNLLAILSLVDPNLVVVENLNLR